MRDRRLRWIRAATWVLLLVNAGYLVATARLNARTRTMVEQVRRENLRLHEENVMLRLKCAELEMGSR